jgi:hypothetical protein
MSQPSQIQPSQIQPSNIGELVDWLRQNHEQWLPQIFSLFRSMPATSQAIPGMQPPGGQQMQQRDVVQDIMPIVQQVIPWLFSLFRSLPQQPGAASRFMAPSWEDWINMPPWLREHIAF